MNIEEIEKELNELKEYIVTMRKIQQSQDTQHANLESVLKERIEKLENDSFYWRGQVSDSKPPEQFESYTIIEEDEEKRVIQCNKPKPPEPTLPNPFKMEYSRDEVAILLKKQKQDLIAEFIQKLKDLPTWSSRDNIFTINQVDINDLIEEYEDSRK